MAQDSNQSASAVFYQQYKIEGMAPLDVREMVLKRPQTYGRILFVGHRDSPPAPRGRAYNLTDKDILVATMVTSDENVGEEAIYIEGSPEGIKKGCRIFEDIFKKKLTPLRQDLGQRVLR